MMSEGARFRTIAAAGLLALAGMTLKAEEAPAAPAPNPFEGAIQAFEQADKTAPPPKGKILCVGSSTFTIWNTMPEDLKPFKVTNRGFGGSQMSDLLLFMDRIVLPYAPRLILVYEGDNDMVSNKKAELLLEQFKEFVTRVRAKLPQTKILFLSIKPSPSRAAAWPEASKANRLIAEFAKTDQRLGFVDIATVILGPDGTPRKEYFLDDMLHLNRQGYEAIIPVIKKAFAQAKANK